MRSHSSLSGATARLHQKPAGAHPLEAPRPKSARSRPRRARSPRAGAGRGRSARRCRAVQAASSAWPCHSVCKWNRGSSNSRARGSDSNTALDDGPCEPREWLSDFPACGAETPEVANFAPAKSLCFTTAVPSGSGRKRKPRWKRGCARPLCRQMCTRSPTTSEPPGPKRSTTPLTPGWRYWGRELNS